MLYTEPRFELEVETATLTGLFPLESSTVPCILYTVPVIVPFKPYKKYITIDYTNESSLSEMSSTDKTAWSYPQSIHFVIIYPLPDLQI